MHELLVANLQLRNLVLEGFLILPKLNESGLASDDVLVPLLDNFQLEIGYLFVGEGDYSGLEIASVVGVEGIVLFEHLQEEGFDRTEHVGLVAVVFLMGFGNPPGEFFLLLGLSVDLFLFGGEETLVLAVCLLKFENEAFLAVYFFLGVAHEFPQVVEFLSEHIVCLFLLGQFVNPILCLLFESVDRVESGLETLISFFESLLVLLYLLLEDGFCGFELFLPLLAFFLHPFALLFVLRQFITDLLDNLLLLFPLAVCLLVAALEILLPRGQDLVGFLYLLDPFVPIDDILVQFVDLLILVAYLLVEFLRGGYVLLDLPFHVLVFGLQMLLVSEDGVVLGFELPLHLFETAAFYIQFVLEIVDAGVGVVGLVGQ